MKDDYLVIYQNKSVFVNSGNEVVFEEGPQSDKSKKNQIKIKEELDDDFLDKLISNSFLSDEENNLLSEQMHNTMHKLVDSITSEVGRAIVGLSVLQLTIKSITPDQSIRLHKSSQSRSSFSWVDGLPMRVIDNTYITPKLREYNLLKLNADGFMMTRSLAENYPYTSLYKANIRGAKEEWVYIVNQIELEPSIALPSLKLLITLLKQRSKDFDEKVIATEEKINTFLNKVTNADVLKRILFSFPESSSYSARLFEILIHSFYCTLDDNKLLGNFLKPLSQMRSANKKHGNIGDVELLKKPNSMLIEEAWDAKFGKSYLRDELEELKDKLEHHLETRIAGFITDSEPTKNKEILTRKQELEEIFGVEIKVESIETWYSNQIELYNISDEFVFLKNWTKIFFEYLFLKRYKIAPIDEPTAIWIDECSSVID